MSLNYSFGQMKVYVGTDTYNQRNLVGKIYSSGEVYRCSNGEEVLWGMVRNDKFYAFGRNNSEILVGIYSDVPTMGGGGRIYVDTGTGSRSMLGFRRGGRFYYGDDIKDESHMIGFHVGDFLHGMNGSYVAAYYLIIDGK